MFLGAFTLIQDRGITWIRLQLKAISRALESCCLFNSWWVTKHHLKLLVGNMKVCMAGTSSISDKAIHERHRACEKLDLALPRQTSWLAHHSLPLSVVVGQNTHYPYPEDAANANPSSWWMIPQLWDHLQHDLADRLMVPFCDLNLLPFSTAAGNVQWREGDPWCYGHSPGDK